MSNAYAWICGVAQGNPGPSGIGVVVKDPSGEVLATVSQYIGKSAQNATDYQALISGLVEAKKRGVTRLTVYTHSMLVREQLVGVLKKRAKHLEPLAQMAHILMNSYEHVELVSIGRERNREAEKLAQQAVASASPGKA